MLTNDKIKKKKFFHKIMKIYEILLLFRLLLCNKLFHKKYEKYENCFLRTVLFHLGCVVASPQLHPPSGTFDPDVPDTL